MNDKAEFETPVMVTYVLTGGITFSVTGVISVEEVDGCLILIKTDDTFTKLAKGWLQYDVSKM